MHCIPMCQGCHAAGICPKGQVPAVVRSKPRRAVRATYPRDVRTVYVHLSCSHITTKEAQVFFSVWRGKGSTQLYCEICKAWVDVAVTERKAPDGLF
jgi:hypothetical protein